MPTLKSKTSKDSSKASSKKASSSKKDSKSKDKNPNIRTKAWGPPMWFALTCIAMGYPERNPTQKQKKCYRNLFTILSDTLPCSLCRDSYVKYIKELPLTDDVLSTRRKLVFWLFKIHNKINKKLKCRVLNSSQLEKKYHYYDKFRAKTCSKTMGGCIKAAEGIRIPKRTKVITYVDEQALAAAASKKTRRR